MKKLVWAIFLIFSAGGVLAQDNPNSTYERDLAAGKAYCTKLQDAIDVFTKAPRHTPPSCTVTTEEVTAKFDEMPIWQDGTHDRQIVEATWQDDHDHVVTAFVLFSSSQ